MSNTAVYTIAPSEWSLVGQLSQIMNLHSKAQAPLRVCYVNTALPTSPAANAEYIVMTNHLPRPVMEPYHQDPYVFIKPDGDTEVEVTVTLINVGSWYQLDPAYGALIAGKVGTVYSTAGQVQIQENFVREGVETLEAPPILSVIEGSLPPGITLVRTADNDSRNFYSLQGTPTTAGTYYFTLAAKLLLPLDEAQHVLAQGRFSIAIAA